MEMNVELFDSIINTSQDCVFWKDKDRRFLGVNQAFLDYYGFESADVLIGKTDEDMGWHSDPEPFKQDELRVLSGRSTYKVQGKCMIKGEERDIIASKRPLYDGDRIVGLVGSFVDITDVLRRREGLDKNQVIYTIDKLRKYPFFDPLIDEIGLDEILDPLTGVLSRAYSLKFVRSLMTEDVPFTFTMVDLDNFKQINDGFGHGAGDLLLMAVSKGLAEVTDGFGLVGRFGGDELLIIDLKNIDMPDKEAFFENLYGDAKVLRTDIEFSDGSAHITGTLGCATFPADAEDFSDLFGLVDKMLYLGKRNGRNCYNIYDHARHRDIEFSKLSKNGVFTDMQRLKMETGGAEDFENKLKAAMPVLSEALHVSDMYYVRKDGRLKAVMDPSFDGDAGDISKLMTGDVYFENTTEPIEKASPVFYNTLKSKNLNSALITVIRSGEEVSGYLVAAVERDNRIWQENECAILYYLAGLME